MNDLSVLINKIMEEAKAYSDKILEAAKAETETTLDRYRAEAQAEAAKITGAAEQQADAIARRAQSQAGIEERNMLLATRRGLIDSAFAKAYELLCALSDSQKIDFLARLAASCQTTDAQLVLSAKEASLGMAIVQKVNEANANKGIKLTLAPETGAFGGGFILREGSTETNCTYEVLVKNIQPQLEAEIAALLLN